MFRPKCTVNGVKSKGRMCSQIIVNGKLCGYDGDCVYKEGHKSNQYALGYKAGLDAAVKVCRDAIAQHWAVDYEERKEAANYLAALIAAIPVPEVQWRDLTASEAIDAIREGAPDGGLQDITRAVIAKFKEKQLCR